VQPGGGPPRGDRNGIGAGIAPPSCVKPMVTNVPASTAINSAPLRPFLRATTAANATGAMINSEGSNNGAVALSGGRLDAGSNGEVNGAGISYGLRIACVLTTQGSAA